jgi:WD40 repeat protein
MIDVLPLPNMTGFAMSLLRYSPDGRFCALLRRNGLALADLHAGREWPLAVKSGFAEYVVPETVAVYRILQQPLETKILHERVKLRTALERLSEFWDNRLPILVDRDAFHTIDSDPYEHEVCLPREPAKMPTIQALRLLISQIGQGKGDFCIRRSFVEITLRGLAREKDVWPPVFSPRGSLVLLAEATRDAGTLHVVECSSGQVNATLAVHPDAGGLYGFTSDDELLFFFGAQESRPVLNVWDTRRKQVARTIPDVAIRPLDELAPDGNTLLITNQDGSVALLNLRSGQRQPLLGMKDEFHRVKFSPDNRTLVRLTGEELQLWDLPGGALRHRIALGTLSHRWPGLFVSADSRVVCAFGVDVWTAWSIDSGERLWARPVPPEDTPPGESGTGRFLANLAATSAPRFTPDRRLLIELQEDRITLVDPATGTSNVGVGGSPTPRNGVGLVFTPDGRRMLSRWIYHDRKQWWVEEWLGKFFEIPEVTSCVVVSDVATGRTQLRLDIRGSLANAALSEDGRTLLTSVWRGDSTVISCWDVPSGPSLLWVVGIPLTIGCIGAAVRWSVGRRGGRHQPIPSATT